MAAAGGTRGAPGGAWWVGAQCVHGACRWGRGASGAQRVGKVQTPLPSARHHQAPAAPPPRVLTVTSWMRWRLHHCPAFLPLHPKPLPHAPSPPSPAQQPAHAHPPNTPATSLPPFPNMRRLAERLAATERTQPQVAVLAGGWKRFRNVSGGCMLTWWLALCPPPAPCMAGSGCAPPPCWQSRPAGHSPPHPIHAPGSLQQFGHEEDLVEGMEGAP